MTNTDMTSSAIAASRAAADSFVHARSFGHVADVAVIRVTDGWSVSGLFSAIGDILNGAIEGADAITEAEALIAAVRDAAEFAESRIPRR